MSASTASTAASVEEERIAARETVYRLAAALFGYPLAETQQVLEDGSLRQALSPAWEMLTGAEWPPLPHSADLTALQVGYTNTFLNGRRGKPRVPLTANAHEALLGGLTPGNYLLNVLAFYRHFGLQTAQGDEGHAEEPDHLVAMLEFCSLLCHLERQALVNQHDPAPYQRAQRDFIARYLEPLLKAIKQRYAKAREHGLDPTLAHMIEVLPLWVSEQQAALSSLVGPCPPPRSSGEYSAAATGSMWD